MSQIKTLMWTGSKITTRHTNSVKEQAVREVLEEVHDYMWLGCQYLLLVQHVELISTDHTQTRIPVGLLVGGSSSEGGLVSVGGGDSIPRIWERRRRRRRRGERVRDCMLIIKIQDRTMLLFQLVQSLWADLTWTYNIWPVCGAVTKHSSANSSSKFK